MKSQGRRDTGREKVTTLCNGQLGGHGDREQEVAGCPGGGGGHTELDS